MKEKGITIGCGFNNFCPQWNISRGQMAVFVIRGIFWALKGNTEDFTHPTEPYFTDVPPNHQWFRYIQKLKELGITSGCTAGTFCPDDPLSYSQMAVFAIRAWQYRTTGSATSSFSTKGTSYLMTDVDGHVFQDYLRKVMDLTIALEGCNPRPVATTFCADYPITRGKAAHYIVGGAMGVFNPSSPDSLGIQPAGTDINLGGFPVEKYTSSSSYLEGCRGTELTVQGCVKKFFNNNAASPPYRYDNYIAQGVRGVRFQFALGNPESSPFNADGTIDEASFIPSLRAFFNDLRGFGILRITPTPTLISNWTGGGDCAGCFPAVQQFVSDCGGGLEARLFYPWLPFGLIPNNYFPYNDNADAYYCAARNSNFWGWQPFYNLIRRIIQEAKAAQLQINDFDIEQELNVSQFPVEGRLIVDNPPGLDPENVFEEILKIFKEPLIDLDETRVTYSTQAVRPPFSSSSYCNSVYGQSALLFHQSGLRAAITGGAFGWPANYLPQVDVICGGQPTGFTTLPLSNPQPAVSNLHAHFCIKPTLEGGCVTAEDCVLANGSNCHATYDVTTAAAAFFNALNSSQGGWGANTVVLGESSSNQRCDGIAPSSAKQLTDGYRASLLKTSSQAVVFRPWTVASSTECFTTPSFINPPYNPAVP